jgi:tetratricopeptide (TPR) repeat protein
MPCPHRALAALAVLTGALATPTSQAAPLDRARQLFVEAELDEDKDRWSDALDKLRAVAQVKLTAGVRYHLALCEEHLGQLARALSDYRAAEDQARIENANDVLRIVGKQLEGLDPRVPRLTFHFAPSIREASVTLDGEPVVDVLAGKALPVDPGGHRIEARAPDRPPWSQDVTLQERESRTIDVNLGEPTTTSPPPATPSGAPPEPPPPPPAPAFPRSVHHPDRSLAVVATGIAIAFVSGGIASYLVADNEHEHAVSNCAHIYDASACDGLRNRVREWDFAAAGSWLGGLLTGAIAVALWTKADKTATGGGARWMVGPTAVGVEGRF